MTGRAFALLALILPGLFRLSAQEMDMEIPDQETLNALRDNPGIIKAVVSQEIGDDSNRWIEMYTDVHVVSAIPMDKLRRTILNFAQYPQMFRRNQKIAVIREADTVCLDMAVGAKFLGIDFLVNYRVLVTETRNTPEEFILDFSHVSDDGSVKDVSGRWHIKKLPRLDGAEQQFYVRYYARSKALRKYPLQRTIMSLFINSESLDLMEQFVKTAGRL